VTFTVDVIGVGAGGDGACPPPLLPPHAPTANRPRLPTIITNTSHDFRLRRKPNQQSNAESEANTGEDEKPEGFAAAEPDK
jgi:hypothetical protein